VAPDNTELLVGHIVEQCPHLVVEGFMTMAPFLDDPLETRPYFRHLRDIRDRLKVGFCDAPNFRGEELSMGMTNDYEVAVEEGATIVRLGTALFGHR
ncbi:MAG: alanine racemase, partial [Candidatus Sumerlaeaceae bacterium]